MIHQVTVCPKPRAAVFQSTGEKPQEYGIKSELRYSCRILRRPNTGRELKPEEDHSSGI